MYTTTQHTTPLQSIFGAGYVLEAHGDDAPHHLPADDASFTDFVKSLGALIWGEASQTKH
jgi:hypothetical protein